MKNKSLVPLGTESWPGAPQSWPEAGGTQSWPGGDGGSSPMKRFGVVAVMGLAMALSTATVTLLPVPPLIRVGRLAAVHPLVFFGDGQLRVRSALFGLVFVAWVSLALVLTRTWHRFRAERRLAIQGVIAVGLGLTVIQLLMGALSSFNVRPSFWATLLLYLPVSVIASASGAYLVSRSTMFVTGRSEPLLSRCMVLWAAGWVGIQQIIEHMRIVSAAAEATAVDTIPGVVKVVHNFAPELVLAWQLPLGLAVAGWFVRTRYASPAAFADRADAARSWGKAIVLVAAALLLLAVAISSFERTRVPADDLEVVPSDPEDYG